MTSIYLKSVSGDKKVELQGEIVAGREQDCDLVLTEGHPSRRHARIKVEGDDVWIEDLGSTNGTFVNDSKVESAVKLGAGDRIRFDAEEFDVVDDRAPAADAAPAADSNATVLRAPPPSMGSKADAPAGGKAAPDEAAAPAPAPAAESAPERSAAAESPEPEQAATARAGSSPEQKPAPQSREVEGGEGGRRPGGWADPNQVKEGGTVLFDNEQLQSLLAESKPSPVPLADADTPYLVVTGGAQSGTTIKLKAGTQTNVWEVGSDADRDLCFDEAGVSGFHAKIVNEGARWKVIDQMSSNGTLVNENRGIINYLSAGDRIRFGPVECVFQLPASAGKATKRAASAGAAAESASSSKTAVIVVAAVVLVAAAAAAAWWLIG